MKLVWSTKIKNSPWSGECENNFIDKGNEIILPCDVILSKKETIRALIFDKKTGIYKDRIIKTPTNILLERQNRISPDKKEYRYGNKIFRSKNAYCIECVENGKQIWQVKHSASWLYTDIVIKNGCALWGTTNGIYCAEIETGKLLCHIKDSHSSGTYDWYFDNVVTFSKDKIVKINPFTAEIIGEYKFERNHPYHTVIKVIDNFAYAVIFTNDNQATVLCLQLE
jgi:hypothetical protein